MGFFFFQGPAVLTDTEVVSLVKSKDIPFYKIEKMVGDHERGVGIRQVVLSILSGMFVRLDTQFEHSLQSLIVRH